ncbi:MAG: hypothetical protein QM820_06840 [Minicystis sp.]
MRSYPLSVVVCAALAGALGGASARWAGAQPAVATAAPRDAGAVPSGSAQPALDPLKKATAALSRKDSKGALRELALGPESADGQYLKAQAFYQLGDVTAARIAGAAWYQGAGKAGDKAAEDRLAKLAELDKAAEDRRQAALAKLAELVKQVGDPTLRPKLMAAAAEPCPDPGGGCVGCMPSPFDTALRAARARMIPDPY